MSGHTPAFVDIVFDGPPSHKSGRFVEVENDRGASIKFGEWVHRDDGFWALRIPETAAELERVLKAVQPFVAFATACRRLLEMDPDHKITAGSPMAGPQIYARDFIALMAAIDRSETSHGD